MEHLDVVIVGAGLSGIGAACHLQTECPGKSYAILEAREAMGGTWDLFRYPGVRSDSDMFTLGYAFRPWRDAKAIAPGGKILDYIVQTAKDHDVARHIRFQKRVLRAAWSSAESRWLLEMQDGEKLSCSFLFCCSGYYRYDQGYQPKFEGIETYRGQVVHPQAWPRDLDVTGKRVVVIGSGATAVTLVPELAKSAAHVTMLQRSPSYVLSMPASDPLANLLRRLLPVKAAYAAVRWKNVLVTMLLFQISRRWPRFMRKLLRKQAVRALPRGYEVETHFNPRYQPWDQRLCLVPDGDLFQAIHAGRASVVTGEISRFNEQGIQLATGGELPADLVVTATGLTLLAFGGMQFTVDGSDIELSKTVGYKGLMLCGVPNFGYVLGYTNASWTLKADLVSSYFCRLLKRMDARGMRSCVPQNPDPSLPTEPMLDLTSGYVQRSLASLPRQGARYPWRLYQNYLRDLLLFRFGRLEDESIQFKR
ncbi:MAG TPA: NAD(P)/FAD-dependent oxidoreductase [Myxococcales bacterium]|nr:NAD(P)/FAD-dependent oxidoreductase [Myxococcales bacterium]